jgi:tetratricopeptide (TPR) repeat protein
MNLLGAYSTMLGDDAHAAAIYQEALGVERRVFPNDVQYARSLTGLSMIVLHQDRPEEALPPAEEALAVALKAEGDQTLDAALAYGNVAEVHRVTGHTERALPLYRKARAIYEHVLGPNHPRVASILSQEGLILMQDGKLTMAEKEMRRSLDMLAKYCPGCVFEEVVGETNLGMLRMKQQRYREADALLEHSVELQEKYWDKRGSLLAATLQALARVKEKERLHSDATRLAKRADLILAFQ